MKKPDTEKQQKSSLQCEALEPRILLSGGSEALLVDSSIFQDDSDNAFQTEVVSLLKQGEEAQTPSQTDTTDVRTELVIVDASTPNYQALLADLQSNTSYTTEFNVLVLDAEKDGVQQINHYLDQFKNVDALHVISHGSDANIQLGNSSLNFDNLGEYSDQLQSWQDNLGADADILIYGCDVADSEAGQDLIDTLSVLTGADVAVSDDLTGHKSLGGDWELEYQVGKIETDVAISLQAQQNWTEVLAAPTADAGGPYSINEGDSVVLDASASSDPDLDPLTYSWDINNDAVFGDVTGVAPTLTWDQLQGFGIDDDGTYTISLQVDDGLGGVDTVSTTIDVTNVAPTVTATGSANAGDGQLYTLNLNAVDPGNDTVTAWTINWGDGSIESIAGDPSTATHTYTGAGYTYNITASATDDDGTYYQNELLVISWDDSSVSRYEAITGNLLQVFATADGMDTGSDMLIGPDGNLYVTGEKSSMVLRYNAQTGAFIDTFVVDGSGGLSGTRGMTFGTDGNLYVSSANTSEVMRYDGTTGAFIDVFVSAASGGLNAGEDMLFGPDGNLYISDYKNHNVLRFDSTTGAFIDEFVAAGSGGLKNATQMTFGPDGNLYVASEGTNNVLRYNGSTGAFIDEFVTAGSGGITEPDGITFGPDGNLYVSGYSSDNVLRYNGTTGAFTDEYVAGQNGAYTLVFMPDHQVTVISNTPPTASDNTVTTTEDTTYTFAAADFNFSDADGDSLASVEVTTLEVAGSLQLSGADVSLNQVISRADIDAGNLKFIPVADANGSSYDSFGFSVNDGITDSVSTYTMTVDVTAQNDAPVANNDSYSVQEDQTLVINALTENATAADLEAAWQFDEGAGTTITDATGNGNDGTINGATWTTSSRTGDAALSFDGVNDYVQTTGSTLDLSTATNFTLTAWFQTDTTTGQHHILWQGVSTQNGWGEPTPGDLNNSEMNLTVGRYDTNDRITFFLGYHDGSPNSIDITSASSFTDTSGWHQATVVVTDLGGGTLQADLYVDGVLEGSDTGNELDRSLWDSELLIGQAGSGTRQFDGLIDEVGIYDRALTVDEVSDLYSTGVIINDTDVDGDVLSASLVTGPSNGTLSFNSDGSFTYTANANYAGNDSFTYKVNDGGLDSNTATVDITVTPVNDVPVATGNTVIASEDVPLVIGAADFSFSDVEGDSLVSVTITDLNLNGGTLTHSAGSVTVTNGMTITAAELADLTFTSALNDSTNSSFSYTVNDADAGVTSAVMNITVNAVNDAPVATNDSYSVQEDQTLVINALTENVTAADLSASWQLDEGTGTTTVDATGNGNDGTLNNGTAWVTSSRTGDAALQFDGVDDNVNLGSDASIDNVFAGGGTLSVWFNAAGWGENGYGRIVDKSADTVATDGWALQLNGATGAIRFEHGFSIQRGGWEAQGVISLGTWHHVVVEYDNSSATNDPLIYVDGVLQTVVETGAAPAGIAASDAAQDLVMGNFTGDTIRTFDGVIDELGIYNRSLTPSEITALSSTGVILNDTDVEGSLLSASLVTGPSNGTLALNSDGSFTYKPNANYTGVDSFTYKVNDGGLDSNTATVDITVTPVNDVPVATGNTVIASEDVPLVIGAADFSFSDVEGDSLVSVTITDLNLNGGTLTHSAGSVTVTNGMTITAAELADLTFTSALNDSTNSSFSYTVNDADAGVTSAVMNITVNAVNDAPQLDLDADDSSGASGLDYQTIYVEANPPVSIVDSDFVLADVDNTELTSIIVTLTNELDGLNKEILSADISGTSLTSLWDNGTSTLTISGVGSLAEYQTVLNTVTYENKGNSPNITDRIITFSVNDGADNSLIATSTVSVVQLDKKAPVANNDTFTVAEGSVGNVLDLAANDSDQDGDLDISSIVIISAPLHGVLTVNGDGTVTYTHDGSENASDSFTYTINDLVGAISNIATVDLTVTPVNDVPTAANNTVTTIEDSNYIFTASDFNFSDVDTGDSLSSVKITSLESVGSLQLNGVDVTTNQVISRVDIDAGNLIFIPIANASGASYDSFGFSVSDGTVDSASSYTMTVDVTAVNDAPTSANNTVITNEDTAYTFAASDFNFSDIDGDSLTSVKITSLESVGALQLSGTDVTLNQVITVADINAGNLKFVPVTNANGATYDSFGFSVNDGTIDSASSYSMTVDVTAVNDAPTATANTVNTTIDTSYTFSAADFNFSDIDGDSLTQVQITTLETAGALQLSGADVALNDVITVADINAGNLKFVPGNAESGTPYTSFQFKVHDGTSYSTAATTLTVNVGANTAPTAANKTVITSEDTTYTFAASDFNFSDADGHSLQQVKITTLETNGALQIDGVDVTLNQVVSIADINAGKLKFVPAANATGVGYDSFAFQVSDGIEYSAAAYTMTVDVTAVNDAPTAANNTVITNEDTAYTFAASDFNFSDIDGDSLTSVKITSLESVGALQLSGTDVTLNQVITVADINAGNLKFVPATNANGAAYDSFGFSVNDATIDSASSYSMTVDVTAVNDAPTSANNTVITNEDTSYTFVASDFNFSDVDGGSFTQVQISGLTSAGSLQLSGVDIVLNDIVTLADINAGLLKFIPAANANGAGYDSFTFKVHDGISYSAASYSMTVDVTAVNDAPIANTETLNATEDTNLTITTTTDLLANDTDTDGDVLSVSTVSQPGNGSLVDNGDGTYSYSPSTNFNGTDSFSYTISDGNGGTDTVTVNVNVAAVNDNPTASDQNYNITQLNNGQVIGTFTATDPDSGDTLTYTLMAGGDSAGFAVDANTGQITISDASQVPTAQTSLSFIVQAMDSSGASTTAQVTISVVLPVVEEPVSPEPGVEVPIPVPIEVITPEETDETTTAGTPEADTVDEILSTGDELESAAANPATPPATAEQQGDGPVDAEKTTEDGETVVDENKRTGEEAVTDKTTFIENMASLKLDNNEFKYTQNRSSLNLFNLISELKQNTPIDAETQETITKMREQLQKSLDEGNEQYELVIASIQGGSISLSVGAAVWALRGGALLASMMSTLPIWTTFDPLPLLAASHRKQPTDVKNKTALDAVEAMFDKVNARELKAGI